jgi:D-alanyl-lipoteichoic acid acyltransferase DltB (MBOAT superfamily)
MVIADRLALYTSAVFSNIDMHNGTSLLVAIIFYSFQIYADFSGYTDIAIGSAGVLGVSLSENFKRPYFALSIKDFWSRWHISLSSWLRDYLFLPLAYFFSRKWKKSQYMRIDTEHIIYIVATMMTFFVCGLWHGEGLHLILWGLIFGVYLSIGHISSRARNKLSKRIGITRLPIIRKGLKIIFTFTLVASAWLVFKVPQMSDIYLAARRILLYRGALFIPNLATMVYSLFGILFIFAFEWREEYYKGRFSLFKNKHKSIRYVSYAFLAIVILLIGVLDNSQFIYFQF